MINIFELEAGRLKQIHVEAKEDLLSVERPFWVDFESPDERERQWANEVFNLRLPDEEDFGDIEASERCFIDKSGALQLRSDFLIDTEDHPHIVHVAFVAKNDILFSLHDEDLPVFRLIRLRARSRPGSLSDWRDLLLDVYDTDVEYSADSLEEVYEKLKEVGERVLHAEMTDAVATAVLSNIAKEEDLIGHIRRNLMDTRRTISFLMRKRVLVGGQTEEALQILRDIESLDGHTSFLFDKINFLMDATVGFVNINQNRIIKIFSVAAVAMLPPTLIASIYGMNFRVLPELDWTLGYPFALGLMVVSVAVPFYIFRKKGWL